MKWFFLLFILSLQGAKVMKPELLQSLFISEHLAAGFKVLVIPGDLSHISTPFTANLVTLWALIKAD